MPDTHLKRTINDWLLHVNIVDQDSHQYSSTNVAAKRKRKLIETGFNEADCGDDTTWNLLLSMSEDGSTSNTSQFSRSLTNRPMLVPTPPSSKRSTGKRSPSPIRKLLALLSKANPPIRICQPGNAVVQPRHVANLRKFLTKDTGVRAIPRVLEDPLRKADPDGFDSLPQHVFDDTVVDFSGELEKLWEGIQDIYLEAERCHNLHKDENAWLEVVRAMFRISGMGTIKDMVEVISVQTQSITSELLPTLPETILPFARKADLALSFNPFHARVKTTIDEVYCARPGLNLSQMSDAYTSTVVLGCGLEVKESGGDYNEATMQLGVWSAAGLEKMQSMLDMTSSGVIMPLLGITAIGHEWKIHIAWKVDKNGETLVVGPFPLLQSSTASYLGIFNLRQLLQRVRDYLCNQFWRWHEKAILQPLCKA
ncbi:hypothetical protein MMC13_005403 [Lambiella insularis]|nr:hypothetical protein [Lambiella insularis]